MLHYITNLSLDGYIEDASGDFGFSEPNDDQFAFMTDLIRPVDTYLYGRKLYQTMSVWETDASLGAMSDLYADFAATWQRPEKIVYSNTLTESVTERTRIERAFNVEVLRGMSGHLLIGGANIAAQAFGVGLVDEVHLFVSPVTLGAGKPAMPIDVRVNLELLEERRFANGIIYGRYAVVG